MSDDRVTYINVSAIKNVRLRRLVIVGSFPFMVLGNTWFVTIAFLRAWIRSNAGLLRSGAEQWRRNAK